MPRNGWGPEGAGPKGQGAPDLKVRPTEANRDQRMYSGSRGGGTGPPRQCASSSRTRCSTSVEHVGWHRPRLELDGLGDDQAAFLQPAAEAADLARERRHIIAGGRDEGRVLLDLLHARS